MSKLIKTYEEFSHKCDRCGGDVNISTMSIFNQDTICMPCKEEEKKDPDYELARQAEAEEVKKGNYNYPGLYPNYTPIKRYDVYKIK
jgi:RecJ-like exonuclease